MERAAFDGSRQRAALTEFQKQAGLDATTAAQAVHLSYPQYNRYLWGSLPLRTDQIRTFAEAYGIKQAELTRALGLLDEDPAQPWDMAEALRGHVLESDIPGLVAKHADESEESQRDAVRGYIRMARRAQRRRNRPA